MELKDILCRYPKYPEDMSDEQKKSLVAELFSWYGKRGFSKTFRSQTDDTSKYDGKSFVVTGKAWNINLYPVPVWNIRFQDGYEITACPDEICIPTWEMIEKKYPENRDEMDPDREKAFVSDCFDAYEAEGFSEKFWSQCGEFQMFTGKPFKVIGRIPAWDGVNNGADLECLPMWQIKFETGQEISAYPEEIIKREMRNNGCPEEFWEE